MLKYHKKQIEFIKLQIMINLNFKLETGLSTKEILKNCGKCQGATITDSNYRQ